MAAGWGPRGPSHVFVVFGGPLFFVACGPVHGKPLFHIFSCFREASQPVSDFFLAGTGRP